MSRKSRDSKKKDRPDVDPVIMQVIVFNPPKGLRKLAEPIGSDRMTVTPIWGKGNAKALLNLIGNPDDTWTIPNEDADVRAAIDEGVIDDDLIDLLLPIMKPSKRPERDRSFLRGSLKETWELLSNIDQDPPDGVTKFKEAHVSSRWPLKAASFCDLMDDDEALARPPRNKMEALGVKATADALENLIRDGRPEFRGDDGAPEMALLNRPGGVETDTQGHLYIADTYNQRIRVITLRAP